MYMSFNFRQCVYVCAFARGSKRDECTCIYRENDIVGSRCKYFINTVGVHVRKRNKFKCIDKFQGCVCLYVWCVREGLTCIILSEVYIFYTE